VDISWREFEAEVRKICEAHEFNTLFRYNFKDEYGRAEIDVIAEKGRILLCIDAKLYSKNRYRVSQLKKEAEKHVKRCERFSKKVGKKAIPIITTLIDDFIYYYEGCIIVPFHFLNHFLAEIYTYLAEFGYL